MTHGSPAPSSDSARVDRPAGRPRLIAADAVAVDAVLEAGFDPARAPGTGREAAVVRLLGALDRLPDADGPRLGDAALVDATLARIERFEDERNAGPIARVAGDDVAAVLPWHRNLIGAAAAIILLASMAVWTNGAGSPNGSSPLASAGILDIPEWDAADARAYVDESDADPASRPIEGALTGQLWVLKTAGGQDRVVFVPDRDRLAGTRILRSRGATLLGPCLMRPQSPPRAATGD